MCFQQRNCVTDLQSHVYLFITYYLFIYLWFLRTGTSGGLLWMRQWTFGFHKMLGISWQAKDLLACPRTLLRGASQSVSQSVNDVHFFAALCLSPDCTSRLTPLLLKRDQGSAMSDAVGRTDENPKCLAFRLLLSELGNTCLWILWLTSKFPFMETGLVRRFYWHI